MRLPTLPVNDYFCLIKHVLETISSIRDDVAQNTSPINSEIDDRRLEVR